MKKKIFLGCLCLLIITFLHGNVHSAAITNEDCMGCHGEKELTGKGPGERPSPCSSIRDLLTNRSMPLFSA